MTICGRLAVLFLAALLLVAQHEAASHAITHLGDPFAQTVQVSEDDAHHDCPECARFAGWAVGVPPAQDALVAVPDARDVVPSLTELRHSTSARGPPRNRGPPLA